MSFEFWKLVQNDLDLFFWWMLLVFGGVIQRMQLLFFGDHWRLRCLRQQAAVVSPKKYGVVSILALGVRVGCLQYFKDDAPNAPHVLRVVILLLN